MAELGDGAGIFEADVLVIGGGTAGPLAAYSSALTKSLPPDFV